MAKFCHLSGTVTGWCTGHQCKSMVGPVVWRGSQPGQQAAMAACEKTGLCCKEAWIEVWVCTETRVCREAEVRGSGATCHTGVDRLHRSGVLCIWMVPTQMKLSVSVGSLGAGKLLFYCCSTAGAPLITALNSSRRYRCHPGYKLTALHQHNPTTGTLTWCRTKHCFGMCPCRRWQMRHRQRLTAAP